LFIIDVVLLSTNSSHYFIIDGKYSTTKIVPTGAFQNSRVDLLNELKESADKTKMNINRRRKRERIK
jgi:hypothetical protein